MAKAQLPQRKPANLSVEQMKVALPKLERRIADLEAFDVSSVQTIRDPLIEVLYKKVNSTLGEILGYDTIDYQDYSWDNVIHSLEIQVPIVTGRISPKRYGSSKPPLTIQDIQRFYDKNINLAIKRISTLKELFEERIADAEARPALSPPQPSPTSNTGKVFIVHGHDHGIKETVARFIENLGLEPIILHEQPNEGRTVIEKFEEHAVADFAIVLFTPDDTGHPANKPDEAKPRARQNVVLELGYFMGKLSRKRVALLQVGDDIEIPSDYVGVLYLPLDGAGAWKFLLAKEMSACGMSIDMNKIC